MNVTELLSIAPILSLTSLSIIVLLINAFVKQSQEISYWLSVIGLVICIVVAINTMGQTGAVLNNMIIAGGYSNFFAVVFLCSSLLTVLLSYGFLKNNHSSVGEFYLLILFSALGMMLMAASADLIVTFLGLELMSISLYVLAGFLRKRIKSNESSLKYFLLGAFATGFLL